MATPPKSPFPRSVVLLLGMKGGHSPTWDEQHRGNRVLQTCWAFVTKGIWPAASRDALFKLCTVKKQKSIIQKKNLSSEYHLYSNSKQLAPFFQFLKSQQHKNVGFFKPLFERWLITWVVFITVNNHERQLNVYARSPQSTAASLLTIQIHLLTFSVENKKTNKQKPMTVMVPLVSDQISERNYYRPHIKC